MKKQTHNFFIRKTTLFTAISTLLNSRGMFLSCALSLPLPLFALPEHGQVQHGQASIQQTSAQQMEIHQTSQRAVIHYESFSIAEGESLTVQQNNSNSTLLNHVTGNHLSEIYGSIQANGRIIISNQAGVLFSAGSQVNVGGLVVSTFALDEDHFMQGQYHYQNNTNTSASIQANGDITTNNGDVTFISPRIQHSGNIQAQSGRVDFQSQPQVFVQEQDSPIALLVDAPDVQAIIENNGEISAEHVNFSANSSNDLYTSLVLHEGMIQARRVYGEGGNISMATDGDLILEGNLNARSDSGNGGNITLNAERIAVTGNINASASSGTVGDGGEITLTAVDTLLLHQSSQVLSNAGLEGRGGIILNYAETTLFRPGAQILAQGGSLSGDGGFIDVSALSQVEFFGYADASAHAGQAGTVYIDPIDIVIDDLGTDNNFDGSFSWDPLGTTGSATIAPSAINNALRLGNNVTIDTASGSGGTGNITFNDNLDLDGAINNATLRMNADGDILFSANTQIHDSNPTSSEQVNLVLNANGDVNMASGSQIDVNTGSLSINAGGSLQLASISGESIGLTASSVNVSDAGISTPGTLSINTGSLSDSDNIILISADQLDFSYTGNTTPLTLQTSINELALNNSSDTNITVNNTSNLVVSGFSSSGDITLNVAGNLIVPTSGLTTNNANLSIFADDLSDPTDRSIELNANQLSISSELAGGHLSVNSNVDELAFNIFGNNNLTFNDSDNIVISSGIMGSTGSISINAPGDITINRSPIELNGAQNSTLSFNAGNDILVGANIADSLGDIDNRTDIHFFTGNNIRINDDTLVHSGNGSIRLVTQNGDIHLTGLTSLSNNTNAIEITSAGRIIDSGDILSHDLQTVNGGVHIQAQQGIEGLETQINTLVLSNSEGLIELTETDDLLIQSLSTDSADIRISANDLHIPDGGLNTSGDLILNVEDIHDGDRNIRFSANALTLAAASPADELLLTTDINQLDIQAQGVQVSVNENSGLSLVDLNGDNSAAIVSNGSFSVEIAEGDLLIDNDILASDNTIDGVRAGLILLQTQTGNITIGTSNSVQVSSINTVENTLGGGITFEGDDSSQVSIALQLANNTGNVRTISLGQGDIPSQVLAQGGDIIIDSLGGAAIGDSSTLEMNISEGSAFNTFNLNGDNVNGSVSLNGELIANGSPFLAASERSIYINASNVPIVIPNDTEEQVDAIVTNSNDTTNETTLILNENPQVEEQTTVKQVFKQVFGDCELYEQNRVGRCKIDSALQAFLSKWTLGGELPPAVGGDNK